MFINYNITEYLGYNISTKIYKYIIRIIDDDFEEEIEVSISRGTFIYTNVTHNCVANAIIKIYSQKQLDVAHNLTMFILKMNESNSHFKINNIIKDLEIYLTEFKPYSNQVKQLLLFA